ncbi:MAG: hypothetical protein JNK29_16515, partial [Anaerolineales bacterium]|nr:hypothetical protein [Anaerolineales bacterium]
MLSVRLFGPPALSAGELPVVLPRRKSRALAFYLAAQSQPVRREALLALFWPEAERAAAQQTLRTTLHGLRKVLGEALVGDEETLALAPAVAVDARQLEAGLRAPGEAAGLAAVLALYRGDVVDGFDLPDAPAFAEWAAAERERYRRLVSRGLTALSLQHEARQDYGAALTALEQALTFDPLQEDIQRAALRLHYLAGDRAGAIRRYEQLRRLLDDELGVPPMAETRALYDAIITDTLARGPARPAVLRAAARSAPTEAEPAGPERGFVPPFTGRAAELAALHVLAAGNRVALLEGEPGIGKSRLAAEFLRTT